MYSQNLEEKYIVDFFGSSRGKFLDIGAYDGKVFSNTFRLAELGWEGVCIEPSPSAFIGLLKNHENNPRIHLVNAAIDPNEEMTEFWDAHGDAISSLDSIHKKKWEPFEAKRGKVFAKLYIKPISISHILKKFGMDFLFVNIDVEGRNSNVLQSIPLNQLSLLKCICIEYDDRKDQIIKDLQPHGFNVLHSNGENLIFVR